jgi:signal transduction histidine kinase
VTTKSKGTGLGLAIVKKLVEEHGGEASIASKVGEGTTVKLMLPVTVLQPASSSVENNKDKRERA